LVCSTQFGVPRRTTIGIDHHRVALLVAVLEKKVGLQLAGQDIFINVAGGVKLNEPAIDLGTICAIASSHLDRAVPADCLLLGEVGLAGEGRGISRPDIRVREAVKLGFSRCLLPPAAARQVKVEGIELVGVASVAEALERLW